MPSKEADKKRKEYLIERISETSQTTLDDYINNIDKRMKDMQKWLTILQTSKNQELFIDLIEGLDTNESFRFCEDLQDISQDVAIEEVVKNMKIQ